LNIINFLGTDDLFCENNPRLIEHKIIDFIVSLKKKGLEYSAIINYVKAILAFYKINDVVLNINKINRFVPEYKKLKKDRGYTHEEIHKLLDIADERMRLVIYILASSGIRITALCSLRIRHLQKDKLTIYEGDKEEYTTFITPECKAAIQTYLEMRKRYGEKITNNSLLVREQFDVRNPGKPKETNRNIIMKKIADLCNRAGIDKSDIPACHGFRKFFTTQLVNAKVNAEIRQMLLGYKIGLASAYYRPSEQEMYQEYFKADNNLTINEENRLKMKVKILESEKTNYEKLDARMDQMQREFYQYKVKTGWAGLTKEDLSEEIIAQKIQERRARDKARRESERRILEKIEKEESRIND
jgi:integrase